MPQTKVFDHDDDDDDNDNNDDNNLKHFIPY